MERRSPSGKRADVVTGEEDPFTAKFLGTGGPVNCALIEFTERHTYVKSASSSNMTLLSIANK